MRIDFYQFGKIVTDGTACRTGLIVPADFVKPNRRQSFFGAGL